MQPQRDLAADQGGRTGVDDLPHLECVGAAHPHREQLVTGKMEGLQKPEMREFLLVATLPRGELRALNTSASSSPYSAASSKSQLSRRISYGSAAAFKSVL